MINVPIWEKANLTLEEAAAYSNLAMMKIVRLFYLLEIKGLSNASFLKNILNKSYSI